MRSGSVVLFLSLAVLPLAAQRPSVTISGISPEGRLIQEIRSEPDDAKKLALAEQFLAQYPKHEGVPGVYSEMLASWAKLGQFDKVMDTAEKLLAEEPADLEPALAAVKAAEGKKDPAAVRKWAVRASDLARKRAQAARAPDEDDELFKVRADFAKQLDTYTEYALYAAALQAPDAAGKVALLKTLEERAPESTYLSQAYGPYFLALIQTGDTASAVPVAEKAIAAGQASEEMLATVSDFYLRQNKEPEKVLDYSSKLIEMANTRAKPEGVSDADWQKRKNYFLGAGQWFTGALYVAQSKYAEGEKALQAALPLLEGNDEIRAGALYSLGIANQGLKKYPEAMKYYEQCSAIQGPFQSLAAGVLKTLKAKYRVVK
ncbi:MAG TPA: tetratricopeptide repeat protein [Bryobacteraceae bacterium]|nr:tetratricopeptide repeat protein [Bryobacteraceae bacterium]